MDDCIFCKIVKGEIPCEKIWEDGSFLAFLDIRPSIEGMTLVIPKKHLSSKIFKNEDAIINNLMSAAKKVSLLLEKSFDIDRVAALFEGMEVDHLHMKLYPLKAGTSIKMFLTEEGAIPTEGELHSTALKIREIR